MSTKIPATITEQVEDIKDCDISYRNLHPVAWMINEETDHTIQFPFSSIINKYRHDLSAILCAVRLTEDEQIKYWYKPKTFSEDMYGTTELWDVILILNNAKSIIDFTPSVVKLYDPNKLKTYLNEIMIIEEELGNISF
jgi:hypothetical protein